MKSHHKFATEFKVRRNVERAYRKRMTMALAGEWDGGLNYDIGMVWDAPLVAYAQIVLARRHDR